MQPGLDCADNKLNGAMEQSKDWVHFALDLPMASPGGQQLVYCTAGPHILLAILTRATGMSTVEYAQSRLFGPVGIAPGSTSWATDPQGVTLGGIERRNRSQAAGVEVWGVLLILVGLIALVGNFGIGLGWRFGLALGAWFVYLGVRHVQAGQPVNWWLVAGGPRPPDWPRRHQHRVR